MRDDDEVQVARCCRCDRELRLLAVYITEDGDSCPACLTDEEREAAGQVE